MRRCYIPSPVAVSETCLITGQDAAHIRKVLRLNPGDRIELFDGAGHIYTACIQIVTADDVRVTVLSENTDPRESWASIQLAVGMLKERKMDDLIRPLTELGITAFHPFFGARSVSRPAPARMENRLMRWKTLAKESLKQCFRTHLPEIHPPVSFEKMLETAADCGIRLIFCEQAVLPLKQAVSPLTSKSENRIFAATGPEGGFTEQEITLARKTGFIVASLGPRILKAETAALTVSVLLQHLFGDLG